jgi:hypothetical protein
MVWWQTFHAAAPSSMLMSTIWPRPVSSRAVSAARMPTAAISDPAPTSATCTGGIIGGPSGAPPYSRTPA